MRADDDLVDLLRREHVLHCGERPVIEDASVGGYPGEPKCREHTIEATPGRRTARVTVDDVSLAGLRDRRDDRDPDRTLFGTAAKGVDELVADERFVRDDEDARGRARPSCVDLLALLRRAENRMTCVRDAVLVRATHDLRDLVEVEDRRG